MLRVENLLYAASGNGVSHSVLRQAVHLADSLRATLHVMPIAQTVDPAEMWHELETYADEDRAVNIKRVRPPERPDQSTSALREYVEREGIDLVATEEPTDQEPVPPRSDSFVRALLGELDQPVYTLGNVPLPERTGRILVPTDLSTPSLVALKHAVGLASICGASIVLLHVIDTSPYVALTPADRLSMRGTTLPEHRACRRLQKFVEEGRAADVPVRSHLKFGEPVEQITRFVTRESIDLVVLYFQGATTSRQPFGTVADRVLERVSTPIFLLKADGPSLLSGAEVPEAGRQQPPEAKA